MFMIINKPNSQTELVKLGERSVEYINSDPFSDTSPVAPVGVVNNSKVGIRTSFGSLRVLFLAPWLIGVCTALFWYVEDFYLGWKAREKTYVNFVEHRQVENGEDYFIRTKDEVALEIYSHLDEYGRLPLRKYLIVIYSGPNGFHYMIEDLVLGSAYILVSLVLLLSIASFKRRAPLYFDRTHRVVYTWRKGRAWAQYYDEQWFYQNRQAMTFILYSFDKKGRFKQRNFVVMPTGNPFMNGETVYRPVLAFITQFMDKGRDNVFNRDWEGRRGWYLFDDKKPQDFDEQLEAILQHIKTERVNEEVDRLATEWGWLGNAQSR